MLSITPACLRGRIRHVLLAAALPAALAAAVLPAAAQAEGFVGFSSGGDLSYSDTSATDNDVLVRVVGNEISVRDRAGVRTTAPCRAATSVEVLCPATARSIQIGTFEGNDVVEYRARHSGGVALGDGVDTAFGGRRESSGQSVEPVRYSGGSGHDEMSYAGADRGVSLTPEDGLANDGRVLFNDRENVDTTFEEFIGSNFSDAPLFGTAHTDLLDGGQGNDQLGGGGGNDVFLASPGDGVDDYHGGPGRDGILYFRYSTPVDVSLDNVANDGAPGERDQVRSNVENIGGGSAGDTLRSLGAFSQLDGGGGADTLDGGAGPDTLVGGPGRDTLDAGGDNDVVSARDGELDDVECGAQTDSATIDDGERTLRDCESLNIGVLRLTPRTVEAEPARTAHVRLSWRHPRAWKQLRSIALRLTRHGVPVGEIEVRPRSERIDADGGVRLVRRASRLTHKGKTVTARLALRLDDTLAGQTLKADVEAVDRRGRRQLEPGAATVRVAR